VGQATESSGCGRTGRTFGIPNHHSAISWFVVNNMADFHLKQRANILCLTCGAYVCMVKSLKCWPTSLNQGRGAAGRRGATSYKLHFEFPAIVAKWTNPYLYIDCVSGVETRRDCLLVAIEKKDQRASSLIIICSVIARLFAGESGLDTQEAESSGISQSLSGRGSGWKKQMIYLYIYPHLGIGSRGDLLGGVSRFRLTYKKPT